MVKVTVVEYDIKNKKFCACNCGEIVKDGNMFINGHNLRLSPKKISSQLRRCYSCGSDKTYTNKKGHEHWTLNWDENNKIIGFLCQACYLHLYYPTKNEKQKRVSREWQKNTTWIWFRDHYVIYKGRFQEPTGKCSKCPNNIYDGSTKSTHMHHQFYIIILPWFSREELCISCHRIRTIQERGMIIKRDNKGRVAKLSYLRKY